VRKKTKRHRTKEQDLAYGIAGTRFFKSYSSKFNKAFDRQTIAYELTRDRNVFADSFWTEDEKKVFEMWKQIQAILNHLNDIYSTFKYIRLKGLKTFLKRNEITENEYLRFMYENHLVRISSTADICALLGDIVFQTGISKRRFNWYKYVNDKKVKNHKSAAVILALVAKLDSLSDERDRIIHFGGHKSEIIKSIESQTFDNKSFKISPFLQRRFKTDRTKELRKLTKEMKANFKLCVRYTMMFMNSLTDEVKVLNV
jgi:Cthe_2314-like HEPN